MTLRAAGVPDERFAYLDSAVDWRRRPPTNHLPLLGTESALFDHRFVALMPGDCLASSCRCQISNGRAFRPTSVLLI